MVEDIEETQGHAPNYPIIGDTNLSVAKLFDMIHPNAGGGAKERTAADNATIRSVFVIGPDKTVKLMITYPDEHRTQLRRGASGARFHAAHGEARGGDAGELEAGRGRDHRAAVSDEEARERFPEGWKAPKPYLRLVPQPE